MSFSHLRRISPILLTVSNKKSIAFYMYVFISCLYRDFLRIEQFGVLFLL